MTSKIVNESITALLNHVDTKIKDAGVSNNLARSIAFDVYLNIVKDIIDDTTDEI